jgi:colanic acid biosynthesis glycosyl transferase WcaI
VKLLILGINYYPELTGISVYNTEMCEYLAQKGHNVVMLTGFPYYPFGTDFSQWYAAKGHAFKLFISENINGVEVKRVNLYKPKKTSTIKRILHEFTFCSLATLKLIFMPGKYNVIVCIAPPLFLGLTAYIISRIKRIPYIFHIKDLQPDAAVELGMIKKGLFCSFLYEVEKFIYKKADKVLTISEGMRNKIIDKGFEKDKVGLFYDWANPGLLKPMSKYNSFTKGFNLQGKFVVLHAGNMGEKQDMRIILEAAEKLNHDNSIHFLIIGRGAKRNFVEDYIISHNLTNTTLLDVQPKEILNEMFASADVALITQTKSVRDIVMPSKVFGPASVARPLIIAANDDCEISRLAKEHEFGIVIEPENSDKLADIITYTKQNTKLLEQIGKNGRLFMVEKRKMENTINDFEETFLKKY